MPQLPFATRLVETSATERLALFSSPLLSMQQGGNTLADKDAVQRLKACPTNIFEQIAFDIEDTVTKAMLAQTGKEEEDSDVPEESKTPIFPVLDSPKRSVCGGCLVTPVSNIGVSDMLNLDVAYDSTTLLGPTEAEWLKQKREEDEEYLLYLKSQSPDGLPLVRL